MSDEPVNDGSEPDAARHAAFDRRYAERQEARRLGKSKPLEQADEEYFRLFLNAVSWEADAALSRVQKSEDGTPLPNRDLVGGFGQIRRKPMRKKMESLAIGWRRDRLKEAERWDALRPEERDSLLQRILENYPEVPE